MVDWLKAIKDFPQDEIDDACSSYLRDQPRRRPTPGDIYNRVSTSLKFKDRHFGHPMLAAPEPEPERTAEQKLNAEVIVRKAGYSLEMKEKLDRNRMATSRDDLEKPAKRVPHWSEMVDQNGPEMEQLRRARIAAGMIEG